MSFKENVIKEALIQKDLRQKKLPIPPEHKKYARLAGLFLAIVGGVGCAAILLISYIGERIFVFAILFTGVIAVMGFSQLISGQHILTRR